MKTVMNDDDYFDDVVYDYCDEFDVYASSPRRKRREALAARRHIERMIEYKKLKELDIDVEYEDLF